MTLFNHNAAFEYFKHLLPAKGFRVNMVAPWNRGRHLLIQVERNGQYKYFYCLFKHTTLHSFNYLFKDFVSSHPDLEGHGESINCEFLDYARQRSATLVYIYPDGKVYTIESYAVFRVCNEHKLIRVQDRENSYKGVHGQVDIVKEKEYVFPIKLLERFY